MEDDKICGAFIKGKNPINLKMHSKSFHKQANLAYLDKLRENAQPFLPETANPRPGSSMMEHEITVGQKTLKQCFHRRHNSCWSVNTQQHHKREEALVHMFIILGCLHDCVSRLPSKSSALHWNQNSKHPELQESIALLGLRWIRQSRN